ncbi:hypothetical protein DUI87_05396 [Hirundo rustica rustica]|uniref:Transmembrane channel-like protein n=1 Tax=Hirundo rustica rustica TaxID=333673 RepID=A0A3M0KYF9_HIRRU|nr:hypothetical protein DUI87_05396 [Hirundo rustica rustica]
MGSSGLGVPERLGRAGGCSGQGPGGGCATEGLEGGFSEHRSGRSHRSPDRWLPLANGCCSFRTMEAGSSQRNPFSHQTPYDPSLHGSYGEHRGREQNYPVAIPMASLGPGSDSSQDLPSTSPYGNFTADDLSSEPEPELTYTPHSTIHLLDYPYTHGISSGSEDSFIRRRNRRPPDETFVISSSMFETAPVCSEEEDLVGSLACMSTKERIKAIQKRPETMRKKREISHFGDLEIPFQNVFTNCGFITIPQFLAAEPNNLSFTGLELLTGAGYFQQTVLYYGFYTNATISKMENGPSYNMQLAYIFTVGIYFVICFLILLFSMAKFFSRNFVNPQAFSANASRLLCTWDFNITNEKAVKLKQKNLHTQIKEDLTEVNKEVLNFSVMERVLRIAVHLVAWVASLGTAAAACTGVYFLSINNLELFMKGHRSDLEGQAAMLVLPVIVSLLNTLIPFFFSWLGHLERFQTPGQHIYVTITRNIILKMSIVGILCYYWLNIVATSESQCWETLVGQDIYRLVLVDFIFCLLGSFFGEFLRRIIGTTVCVSLGLPEFDIGRNVLDLIYAQTLTCNFSGIDLNQVEVTGNSTPKCPHLFKGQSDEELPAPSQSLENCSNDDILHSPAVLSFLPWSPVCHWSRCLEVWKITGIQAYLNDAV